MKKRKAKFSRDTFAPSRKHLREEILDMVDSMDGAMTSTTPEALRSMSRKRLLQERAFWQRVVAFETQPETTLARILIDEGVALPLPESLNDKALNNKLWKVIHALAEMNTYLDATNHLSDRSLYQHLFTKELNRPTKDPRNMQGFTLIDLLGDGSEESTRLFYTYYADVYDRDMWMDEFPDYDMPERQDAPHDRDRHLPRWGDKR